MVRGYVMVRDYMMAALRCADYVITRCALLQCWERVDGWWGSSGNPALISRPSPNQIQSSQVKSC